jgi:hypothetical protein
LWYDPARWPRLAPNHLYDVVRGVRVSELGHPTHDLNEVVFSPDGRWITLTEPLESGSRLLIAPVDAGGRPSPSSQWIEIARATSGVGWPVWSDAGDIIYYGSNRDGPYCIWAQRLERDTMKPAGPPVAIYHAHSARLSIRNIGPVGRAIAAARDRVVFTMSEMTSNIWMTEFPSR